MQCNRKVALIVGGSGAIGQATAVALAQQGASVVLASRNGSAAEKTLAKVREFEADGIFVQTDVKDPNSVAQLVKSAVEKFGSIDFAFNNAGWEGTAEDCAEIDEADWLTMIDIKLNGMWRCVKNEILQMRTQGGGTIVNMAGSWGLEGFPKYSSYCAAAHGVVGLTKAAAMECAPDGIRINAVCPGAVDAPMLDRIVGGDSALKASFGTAVPMGRLCTPDEVAQSVLWLLSDASSYVTGHSLVMNGGT